MARATILVVAIVALLCIQCSWAVQYQVGDTQGWDVSTDLKTWESNKILRVGDSLVFQYSSAHSLVEVDKAGYDSCSSANAMASHSDGLTTITLSKAGKRYFICGTPGHCSSGMKLEVDTLAATAPSPAPAKAPVAAASPTPMATIPASPTPEGEVNGAPEAPKTNPSSSPVHAPVASPHTANGATVTGFGGFVALAGSTIVALRIML